MFGLIWMLSTRIRYFLRRYAPTNVLVAALRTRRGLKWGMPAMLLAVPYLFATSLCAEAAARTGSGWLNILVLVFVWNTLKFTVAGPLCLARLIVVRLQEARARRRARVPILSEGIQLYRVVESEESRPARRLEASR